MKKKPTTKQFSIETSMFSNKGMDMQMKAIYNDEKGAYTLVREPGTPWTLHRHFYRGSLPTNMIQMWVDLFKRGVLKLDPKVTFMEESNSGRRTNRRNPVSGRGRRQPNRRSKAL
jgi:hypothetical protein